MDKNLGSLYGIVTPALVGTILAGNNLIIESEKTDGGIAVFKMDGEGASLHNASFNLYGSSGGRIDLGAVFGIVGGGDKNTMFYYNSKGQPTGVRTEKGRSVTRISSLSSGDVPNANFWIDMYGDVYLKGTIDAVSGIFRGSLEVGGPTAFRVDKQGNLSIGGTATNPNFYVDANGNMKAKSADIKGRVDASSLYIGGKNILTNTSGSNHLATGSSKIDSDYLDLYGITIRNKNTNGVTFQVSDSGVVTINGNITMGAGSVINWATVDQSGENPQVTSLRNTVNNQISGLQTDMSNMRYDMNHQFNIINQDIDYRMSWMRDDINDIEYNLRLVQDNMLSNWEVQNIASTVITNKLIQAPTIQGAYIQGGTMQGVRFYLGSFGSIYDGYGSDGVRRTDLVYIESSRGIAIAASEGMRLEAGGGLWLNCDVHVRVGGRWTTLDEALSK